MDRKEIVYENMDLSQLAEDRKWWGALVSMVMNLPVI
jgi:hypothetical protein